MEKKEYAVQYVSVSGGYSTTVENVSWTDEEMDLYFDDTAEFWLTGARSGDGIVLRDKDCKVVKEYYV